MKAPLWELWHFCSIPAKTCTDQLRNKPDTHTVQGEALRSVLRWNRLKSQLEEWASYGNQEIKIQLHYLFFYLCFNLKFAVEELFGWLSDFPQYAIYQPPKKDRITFHCNREGCSQAQEVFWHLSTLLFLFRCHDQRALMRRRRGARATEDEDSVCIWFSHSFLPRPIISWFSMTHLSHKIYMQRKTNQLIFLSHTESAGLLKLMKSRKNLRNKWWSNKLHWTLESVSARFSPGR